MHHQSKERNMSKSQQQQKKQTKKKQKKIDKGSSFGLARLRFNEVRINEAPLYWFFQEVVE